jgi:hypothetical protein
MCAAEGSKVLMVNGTRKAIEELVKGDRVLGVDGKPDELIDDPSPACRKSAKSKPQN